MQTLADGSGIYLTGRTPETVIRGNFVHHVPSTPGRAPNDGIRMDQGAGGLAIEENLIWQIGEYLLNSHHPRSGEATLRRNVFAYDPAAARRKGWDGHPLRISNRHLWQIEDNRFLTFSSRAGSAGAPLPDELTRAVKAWTERTGPREAARSAPAGNKDNSG
jgi:hypothetical protein